MKIMNFLAKYSVAKWNKNRILRKLCRMLYHAISEFWIRTHKNVWHDRWRDPINGNKRFRDVYNTYPWPYAWSTFAAWEEEDDSLITDPSRFVIRRSTSYCAWKIRELTGKWPTRPNRERYDAKRWDELLALWGYHKAKELYNGQHYIGVDKTTGEFGEVVWLEEPQTLLEGNCRISTYRNFKFYISNVPKDQYTWYQIS